MRLRFLPQAEIDLIWYRRYYAFVFPEGRRNASAHFLKTLSILTSNPRIGKLVSDTAVRELSVPRTPFSLIYRLSNEEISVMRVIDQRSSFDIGEIDEN